MSTSVFIVFTTKTSSSETSLQLRLFTVAGGMLGSTHPSGFANNLRVICRLVYKSLYKAALMHEVSTMKCISLDSEFISPKFPSENKHAEASNETKTDLKAVYFSLIRLHFYIIPIVIMSVIWRGSRFWPNSLHIFITAVCWGLKLLCHDIDHENSWSKNFRHLDPLLCLFLLFTHPAGRGNATLGAQNPKRKRCLLVFEKVIWTLGILTRRADPCFPESCLSEPLYFPDYWGNYNTPYKMLIFSFSLQCNTPKSFFVLQWIQVVESSTVNYKFS